MEWRDVTALYQLECSGDARLWLQFHSCVESKDGQSTALGKTWRFLRRVEWCARTRRRLVQVEVAKRDESDVVGSAERLLGGGGGGGGVVWFCALGRGCTYKTVDELAPHGDEPVEFLVNDDFFHHPVDLTVQARPDSGMDVRQGHSGPEPRPETNDNVQMEKDNNHNEGKGDKSIGLDLGALEKYLLEYQFSEVDGKVDGNILLMTPSSFTSPTKKELASLSPVDSIGLAID